MLGTRHDRRDLGHGVRRARLRASGLGSLAVNAAQQNDIAVLQGATLYFGLLAVAINLVVDLSYGWLNPRVRRVMTEISPSRHRGREPHSGPCRPKAVPDPAGFLARLLGRPLALLALIWMAIVDGRRIVRRPYLEL